MSVIADSNDWRPGLNCRPIEAAGTAFCPMLVQGQQIAAVVAAAAAAVAAAAAAVAAAAVAAAAAAVTINACDAHRDVCAHSIYQHMIM